MSDRIAKIANSKARAVVVMCPDTAVLGFANGLPAAMVAIPTPLTPEFDNKYVIAVSDDAMERMAEHVGVAEATDRMIATAFQMLDRVAETA